jgi:hypothetical protein
VNKLVSVKNNNKKGEFMAKKKVKKAAKVVTNTQEKVCKQELPPTKDKMTRIESVVAILQKDSKLNKETLIKQADAMYAQHGGKSNLRESRWVSGYVIPTLTVAGLLTEENGVFQLKK